MVSERPATSALTLTGERTLPGIWHENYWLRRHEVAYDVFAPICADVNTATNIVLLIAPHYPQVIDGATALALFQSAVTCAELTGAGA